MLHGEEKGTPHCEFGRHSNLFSISQPPSIIEEFLSPIVPLLTLSRPPLLPQSPHTPPPTSPQPFDRT